MGIYIILGLQCLIGIMLAKNIKKYLTTKQQYDKFKKAEQDLNNDIVMFNSDKEKLELQKQAHQAQVANINEYIQDLNIYRDDLNERDKYFKNGVFYDKENDTIVIIENLERVGEL